MVVRKHMPVILMLILALAGVSATMVYFSSKITVDILPNDMKVSPSSFSLDIAAGGHYVKKITIKNYGKERRVYFEDTVEGTDPTKIDISYHREDGTSISSSNRLLIPAGNRDNPSEITINVHIDVDEDAPSGSYSIFISSKG
ncbi:DUF4832 domain-containing protein [Archaeoglobus neptunius]|uniref:DUF4832 domain-containing protein n=1 Tax=Archaeoglobus neptunius TaxID=2798580 RepID=UPI001E4CB5B5|nr:DUF4832 domain-containing protein [Archaeoglobus neptunius]